MAFPQMLCNKRCYQCCKCCADQCNSNFKKVMDLKNSGLSVYIHHKCKKKAPLSEDKYDAIILFNTTNKHHKGSTFLSELGQHSVECFKCKDIIQRVRNLLAEIKCIKGNQTIGVCDYCKQANITNCKRCQYFVNKFMNDSAEAQEAMIHYLIAWVRKVMNSLQFSVEGHLDKHNLHIRDNCVEELQRLLSELESPSSIRQPDYFKTVMNKVMAALQTMLEGFVDKYKLNVKDESVEELLRVLNEFKTLTAKGPLSRQPNIEYFPIVEEIKSLDNLKVMELLDLLMSRLNTQYEITVGDSVSSINTLFVKAKDSTKIVKKSSFDNTSFDENDRKNAEVRALRGELNKNKENIPPDIKIKKSASKSEEKYRKRSEKGKELSSGASKSYTKAEKRTMTQKITTSEVKQKNIDSKKIKKGESKDPKTKNKIKDSSTDKIGELKTKNKIKDTSKDKIGEPKLKKKVKDTSKDKKEERETSKDKNVDKVDNKMKEKQLEERMMKNIMQKEGKKKQQTLQVKNTPLPNIKLQSMLDLPIQNKMELVDISSSSILECVDTKGIPNVMIKRQHIVPLNPHYGKQDGSTSPVQYQTLNSISDTILQLNVTHKAQDIEPDYSSSTGIKSVKQEMQKNVSDRSNKGHHVRQQTFKIPLLYHVYKNISSHSLSNVSPPKPSVEELPTVTKRDKSLEVNDKGVIKYQLSDPDCITKGWTRLPSLRVMRRINMYRMEPVNTANNWFDRNKKSTVLYTGSDDVLADIDEFGYGKLFYKNGRVALDYYKAEEPNVNYRYVIYSDGEPKNGFPEPVTILGVFDGIGCGIVYDNYGRERLKYNQSEGIVIDKSIDSPCKWKWHTLNDPPVLQPVFLDTFTKDTSTLKHIESESGSAYAQNKNVDMLAIELQNFLKEKADKLLQKFKALEIKSKTLKLNQQFSLQILRQTVIYLVFREELTSLKLNLGLTLISNDIIGTESQDVGDLFTSYNQIPPRSKSVENIQQILYTAKRAKKKKISPKYFF
ncbi:uncharacterized protein LOC128676759 [Plodia interpunctella]|uniref:uncharacterized protein LOC128676759 n=1 Tax=Plodia interpunctella TaxID=58824 RepID=UPI002368D420|nr:uncharacterized protein LOC128676759 [Plodia interpunctella]